MNDQPVQRRGLLLFALAISIVLGVSAFVLWRPTSPKAVENGGNLLIRSRAALQRGDYARAESLALEAAQQPDSDGWGWIVAAEAAVRAGRLTDALKYYQRVESSDQHLLSTAAHGRGEMCLQLGEWTLAERDLLAAIKLEPTNHYSRRRLADLYNLTGQRSRAVPLMLELLTTAQTNESDLFYLGDVDHGVQIANAFPGISLDSATDPLVHLGLGHAALAENRIDAAVASFKIARNQMSDSPAACAGLGQALLQQGSKELVTWQSSLPDIVVHDPAVMAVLGQIAEQASDFQTAVQYYAADVKHRPQSRIAWHRFGLALSQIGEEREASIALEQAQRLQELALWLDDLFEHREHLELVRRVAFRLAELGRTTEAMVWAQYALQLNPLSDWARQLAVTLSSAPNSLAQADVLLQLANAVEKWAPADPVQMASKSVEAQQRVAEQDSSETPFRFQNDAAASGLDFVHRSARDSATPGARILETTGGGVGVIDYDVDGWPDVYFPQGFEDFPPTSSNLLTDQLFRNVGGMHWTIITQQARFADAEFGQGIAVGDLDHDGFSDLYIANYGGNRLWENLGDGTFQDVTPQPILDQKVWTTSCAIVDVNGDGHPDLFDVTYCRGRKVETRICEQGGRPRSCSPRAFQAEVDRLWLSGGDGSWTSAASESLNLADGLGLGVVAFRPAVDEPLTLFIANDESPNYWLVPESNGEFQLRNQAPLSGLSVDAEGKPQACMGVACGDFDGNGLPDLFITNFYHESNTLYSALSPDFYSDQTRATHLRDPSWNMLGFGTQFLDIDRDSRPDLVVANGHIDDLSSIGEPYEMPLQFFSNQSTLFAEEVRAVEVAPGLGRGLARLDWNRDGRDDVVIVNQDSPATLLTNLTNPEGHSFIIELQGTLSPRVPVGTILKLHSGSRVLTTQLTGGDGYMTSNDKRLVIGLGATDIVDQIDIHWPTGQVETLKNLKANVPWAIREGSGRAWQLR